MVFFHLPFSHLPVSFLLLSFLLLSSFLLCALAPLRENSHRYAPIGFAAYLDGQPRRFFFSSDWERLPGINSWIKLLPSRWVRSIISDTYCQLADLTADCGQSKRPKVLTFSSLSKFAQSITPQTTVFSRGSYRTQLYRVGFLVCRRSRFNRILSIGRVAVFSILPRRLSYMTSQEVLNFVQARPFRPFQIRMNSGRTFDIRHPEMVRVGRRDVLIFTFVSDSPDVYDKWQNVSLVLIESLTPLDAAVA